MPLTLVHPVRAGQDPPVRRRKGLPSSLLSLSPDEAQHLRASLRNIARARYGTLRKLAAALKVPAKSLSRKRPGPGIAVAVWRLTGTPLEELLRGPLAALPGGAP